MTRRKLLFPLRLSIGAVPVRVSDLQIALRKRFAPGRLSRNSLFTAGQSLIVLSCLFLVYRLVVGYVGIEQLGIWSLLLSGSALARVGDVSGAGALARFVAIGQLDSVETRTRDTVHTVMLTSFCINSIVSIGILSCAPYVLPMFVSEHYIAEARSLVPWVCAVIVLGGLAVTTASGLDGAQRADQRALVMVAAAVVCLFATWLLVPRFGVMGFGAAQAFQQFTILVFGWIVLRRHVAGLGWLPYRWTRGIFVETTGYAFKLNAISVLGLLFEPLVKISFNQAGGPTEVALYELASRLVTQVRGLVIAAATPLVPVFASRSESDYIAFKQTLEYATRAAAVAASGVALATLIGAPIASFFVLRKVAPELLIMNAALTLGWSLQLPCLAFYLAAQGAGTLRWNFLSHALIAVSTVLGVLLLVPAFGSAGLISAIVAGLSLSMLVVLFGNAYTFEAMDVVWKLRWWLISTSTFIVIICLLSCVFCSAVWSKIS